MTSRSLIVKTTHGWLGTPYVHQASTKGAGADCLGLLRGVWRELYGKEAQYVPPYSADWDEVAKTDVLQRAARKHLCEKPTAEMKPGDVLLFRMRAGAVAKHLGIVAACGDAPRFYHAYQRHGVVLTALSEPWVRRIDGVFSFPTAEH